MNKTDLTTIILIIAVLSLNTYLLIKQIDYKNEIKRQDLIIEQIMTNEYHNVGTYADGPDVSVEEVEF